jgi:hypothetical protein
VTKNTGNGPRMNSLITEWDTLPECPSTKIRVLLTRMQKKNVRETVPDMSVGDITMAADYMTPAQSQNA